MSTKPTPEEEAKMYTGSQELFKLREGPYRLSKTAVSSSRDGRCYQLTLAAFSIISAY